MLPYAKALAEAFEKEQRNVMIVCEGGGSTAGLLALKNKAIDIAMDSRGQTVTDDNENTKSYLVGRDGVAIVVHRTNPLADLSLDQVRDIFEGRLTNWRELGWSGGTISVVNREPGSKTRDGLEKMALEGLPVKERAEPVRSAAEMLQAVSGDPRAVGYLALWDLKQSVKALSIEGVAMNRHTILSGRYPLARSFHFVVHDEAGKFTARFVEFSLGAEGQAILEKEGLVRVR
jgi:phosphate transport system substrate-binding protein